MPTRGRIPPAELAGILGIVTDGSEEASEEAVAADIAARIREGSREAEAEMAHRYGNGLLYMLKRRTRDAEAALDLRQETLRVAIEKLRSSTIEQPERLGAYLRGIALNLLVAQQRKEARRATTPDTDAIDAVADQRAGPFEDISSEQVRGAVTALLAELRTPRDREILTRVYLDDEDKEDICRALGVDSLHFNRVLFRAKERFRELLLRAERKRRLHLVTPETIGRDEAL